MFVSVLLLIGAVQAIFLAFVLMFKNELKFADKFLNAWLIFIGIHLLFVNMGFSGLYEVYPNLIIFGAALMLLQGPFLYLYTLISTNRIQKLRPIDLLHALPYLTFTVYLGFTLFGVESSNRYDYANSMISNSNNIWIVSLGLLNHIHLIIYLGVSILVLKRHTQSLPDNFSYVEGINLKWLNNLFIGITVIAGIILVGLLTSDIFPIMSHYVKASLIYSALAILPFYLSFYAFRQKIIYPSRIDNVNTKYQSSGLTALESKDISQRLQNYMEEEKPYLHSKLTIKELSEALDIHPKQLSQVINENFGVNFFNFINQHRIQEFKQRVKDPKNNPYTLISIAYDCGFNTKSSFNSIFKKATGMTPSAYKASLD